MKIKTVIIKLKDKILKLRGNRHLIDSQDLIGAAICKSVVIGRIANNIANSLTSVCILQNCNNPIMQLWWMERGFLSFFNIEECISFEYSSSCLKCKFLSRI